MNLLKKHTVKPYYFLVNDTAHASGNHLLFRNNLVKGI